MTINMYNPFDIYNLSEGFSKLKAAKQKQELLTSAEDQKKYGKKKDEWFDMKNNNPGQIGKPKRIEQTITQTIPALDTRDMARPWKVEKAKKPREVKVLEMSP